MTCNVPDTSMNPLSNAGFRLVINRLPNVSFWCNNVPLPSITSPEAPQATTFQSIVHPGTSLRFEPLTARFRVNEDMTNYTEVYDWMVENGFPDNFDQYNSSGQGVKSDMTLMILGSNFTPQVEFTFEDAFPIALGGAEFNSQNPDVVYVEATATFRYRKFRYKRL